MSQNDNMKSNETNIKRTDLYRIRREVTEVKLREFNKEKEEVIRNCSSEVD